MSFEIINHRVNSSSELVNIPRSEWVEIDLRTFGSEIIVQHEVLSDGELFSSWLNNFDHKGLVLNVKVDGLEVILTKIMKARDLTNYFILDSQPASTYRLPVQITRKIALRMSDLEIPSEMQLLKHRNGWIWLDYFEDPNSLIGLLPNLPETMKICLASPEIVPGSNISISQIVGLLGENLNRISAVATRNPAQWRKT